MTLSQTIVDEVYTVQWTKRWEKLCDARFRNDLEVAQLAKEIREEFPKGAAGDQMFMKFIKENLKQCRKDVMLAKADSFDVFEDSDWSRFGGWSGIGFLFKLLPKQRKQVIALMPGPGPYHYSTIKKNAKSVGIDPQAQSGLGRPSEDARTRGVIAVGNWLTELYRRHPQLEPMPIEVRKALARTHPPTPTSPAHGARA